MREILFRGKRVGNGEWLQGYYKPCGIHIGTIEEEIYPTISEFGSPLGFEVIPETVGQFTGLTDKNGKKIFEGDIGRYKQTDGAKRNGKLIICIGKVVYNANTASFAVESKDESGCKYFDYFPIKDFDVIGNIHDNPELVGGTEDGK